MACNYWTSTQHAAEASLSWEVLANSHKGDRALLTMEEINLIKICFCDLIKQLGTHANIKTRPRIVATAIMYFRREEFSLHDPLLIAPVCFLLACKAGECQTQAVKVTEAMMNLTKEKVTFAYPPATLHEAEYKVLRGLDYNLIVFDVYTELKPLLVSCGLAPSIAALEGQLNPVCAAVWSAANDSYLLTDAALLFPPHVVALACIVVGACVMHQVDLRWWFATLSRRPDLESDIRHVWEVVSAMLDGYRLWDRIKDGFTALEKLPLSRPVAITPADRRP